MSENKTYLMREKTAAIKKALVRALPDAKVSVTHGRGTAYGWITSRVLVAAPAGCIGHEAPEWRPYSQCEACKTLSRTLHEKVETVARAAIAPLGGFGHYYSDDGYSTPSEEHLVQVDFASKKEAALVA